MEVSGTETKLPWTVTVLSLFPEMFPGPLNYSLAGQALNKGIWKVNSVDIRAFACDKHRSVDDMPFGGGFGMVMRPDVIDIAIRTIHRVGSLIYLTPRGRLLDQEKVRSLSKEQRITILCGHFEGVDQRVLDAHDVEEVSIGDFVLSGGEIAALVLIDAVVRLLPGVIGKKESLIEESFELKLLEYPHYTRPKNWEGREVPKVLVSGHHEKIRTWRKCQAENITKVRRPDLWRQYVVAKNEED
ncbi:MAG: tRNA (guanosine(37)-N1)-methyltransferase TrmD [Rhodospirillaceae bacterium]|nr:tRNA (guanosine(37)-N1)-methyltransferase TrmD [Rhodospirillaceae bacterium]